MDSMVEISKLLGLEHWGQLEGPCHIEAMSEQWRDENANNCILSHTGKRPTRGLPFGLTWHGEDMM
jgi:hypothetical protein